MDSDIQFGELEEATPEVRLRPDQNMHFVVVPVYQPDETDLPMFVDVDVMRDIEQHALTNTNVELGGVLLGGQFHDDEGNPYVVITDSLRAEHYEATKGSFKFTHETWEAITRQRDEFPDDLQMVGWYHTHPDWGVFLSGMDMFICDNFFNRKLDVALVVDPCRDDRGWFMWTGDPGQRVRRTGGFYLIGSRFREAEIEFFAELLEGEHDMPAQSRRSSIAGNVGTHQPAPIVNISDSRGSGQTLVVLGMLTMQFLVLALIAWQLFSRSDNGANSSEMLARQTKIREEARSELMAEFLTGVDPTIGKKLVAKYEESEKELRSARLIEDSLTEKAAALYAENSKVSRQLEKSEMEHRSAVEQLEEIRKQRDEISDRYDRLKGAGAKAGTAGGESAWQSWTWAAAGLLALISALAGFGAAMFTRNDEDEYGQQRGDRFGSSLSGKKDEKDSKEADSDSELKSRNMDDPQRENSAEGNDDTPADDQGNTGISFSDNR